MNADAFAQALHQLLMVEHRTRYRDQLVAAQDLVVIPGFDLGEPSEADQFLASLDQTQQERYLAQVRTVISNTATAILEVLDGDEPLGDRPRAFSLVPEGGSDIAGELSRSFADAEHASATSAGRAGADVEERHLEDGDLEDRDLENRDLEDGDLEDGDLEDDEEDVAPDLDAEEFVDRLREVLFGEQLPMHAEQVADIARSADDPSAHGHGSPAFSFLAGLDQTQRAAYLGQVRAVINDTGAAVLGLLDGSTLTRGQYLAFAVIPPGGAENIAGDLQELFLMADEDGPFAA